MGPKLKNQAKVYKKYFSNQEKNESSKSINLRKRDSYLADDSNFKKFSEQLAKLNLELRDINGDGNCLFRALSDQIIGNESNHLAYRRQICDFMRANREDFEPFVAALSDEIDENEKKKGASNSRTDAFEKYLQNLEQPGVYGGNDALVAFARLNQIEINVHQLNRPIWKINGALNNPRQSGIKQIHLAYHNGEHYSSIRKVGDLTNNPTNIQISTVPIDETPTKKKPEKLKNQTKYYEEFYEDSYETNDGSDELNDNIDNIMNVTNCYDVNLIKEVYQENKKNINDTISALLNMLSVIQETKSDETLNKDKTNNKSDSDSDDNENIQNNTTNKTKVKKLNAREKKMLKKQRQMERQRIKVLEEREKEKLKETKVTTNKPNQVEIKDEQTEICPNNNENHEVSIELVNVEATNI